jgi:hypothetical protein
MQIAAETDGPTNPCIRSSKITNQQHNKRRPNIIYDQDKDLGKLGDVRVDRHHELQATTQSSCHFVTRTGLR